MEKDNLYEMRTETMLEGLYKAAEHLVTVLRTAEGEHKTAFTAKELLMPIGKGGTELKWPKQIPDYCITTATAKYEVQGQSLFVVIERAEKVLGVATAKRKRFTILPEKQGGGDVVARFTFEADKMLTNLKACCDGKDSVRAVMQSPALDYERGMVVATDSEMLAAHRLQGLTADVRDKSALDAMQYVSLPIEITKMKGTVTVEVRRAKQNCDDLLTMATDSQGRHGEVEQTTRFPNWASVVPNKVGRGTTIYAKAICKAVKQLTPSIPYSGMMYMTAEKGSRELVLSTKDHDYDTSAKVGVTMENGVAEGVWCAVSAWIINNAMAFAPTTMHFNGEDMAILWLSDNDIVLQMPMLRDEEDKPKSVDRTERFDLEAWVKPKKSASRNNDIPKSRNNDKTKAAAPQPSAIKPQSSFAELLRKVLLAA